MTDQSQTPEQQGAAGQQPAPSAPAGEPEAPVAPPPPTEPLEASGDTPAAPWVPPAPAPPSTGAVPPFGAAVASGDGSPPSSLASERPEVLAGAAFAGGFLLALILKRLAG